MEQNRTNQNIWHDNSSNVPTTLMNQVVHMLNQPNTQPNTETTHWDNSLTSGYRLLKVAKLSFSSMGNSTENYSNYVLKDREKMILKIEDYRNVLFNENCSTIINQITCVTVLEM